MGRPREKLKDQEHFELWKNRILGMNLDYFTMTTTMLMVLKLAKEWVWLTDKAVACLLKITGSICLFVTYIASLHVHTLSLWRVYMCVCVFMCARARVCWATITDVQSKTDLSLLLLFYRLAFHWWKSEYGTPRQQIKWNCYSLITHSRLSGLSWIVNKPLILFEAYFGKDLGKYKWNNHVECSFF